MYCPAVPVIHLFDLPIFVYFIFVMFNSFFQTTEAIEVHTHNITITKDHNSFIIITLKKKKVRQSFQRHKTVSSNYLNRFCCRFRNRFGKHEDFANSYALGNKSYLYDLWVVV